MGVLAGVVEDQAGDAGGVEFYQAGRGAGPRGIFLTTPDRLESSPWRDRLEGAAAQRGFTVHWYRIAAPGWFGLRCEVRDREGLTRKKGGLTKRADMADYATLAEGVAEWIMDPIT